MSAGDVLVVDDNPGDRRFVEEAFRTSRLETTVHTTSGKDEALDFVYRRNEYEDAPALDVVLLDWNLSRATGKEVLEAAKSVEPAVPVVVMTGSKPESESVTSSLSEADGYMEKPTEPEQYVEALRPFLTGR